MSRPNPKREAQRAAKAKQRHFKQLDRARKGLLPGVRRWSK